MPFVLSELRTFHVPPAQGFLACSRAQKAQSGEQQMVKLMLRLTLKGTPVLLMVNYPFYEPPQRWIFAALHEAEGPPKKVFIAVAK